MQVLEYQILFLLNTLEAFINVALLHSYPYDFT